MSRRTRVSRREFTRRTVVAGAAAVTVPGTLLAAGSPAKARVDVKAAAATVARRLGVRMPPEVAYGGVGLTGRGDVMLDQTPQTAAYRDGWREGTTIPAEYYIAEKHYLNDERFIAENFWLMTDHETRIPKPGDYYVFEFGRGDSVMVVRNQAGAVQAFHNVCRHRGSRLCLHDMDKVLPSEARPDGKPADPVLSVVQLGPHGNTPVFRCPYHAWTYDLDGRLVSFPPGMPGGFDPARHGLHRAHVRLLEGFIFVSFARQTAPEFDNFVSNFRDVSRQFGTKGLKVVARRQYPTRGNWKLAVENFRECYHCLPSHTKSYSAVHGLLTGTSASGVPPSAERRAAIEQEVVRHGHSPRPAAPPGSSDAPPVMGAGGSNQHLKLGFMTGSLDGKPVAPLLPARSEWTHTSRAATSGFSTSYLQAYDDHVACARFTPRDVDLTDVELFWLVRADAREKDYDVERMVALWDHTYREDRWIVENNHHGIKNSWYSFDGGQPYAASEGGPAGFVKWYMTEIVSRA
jgi:Rieske 2Fe-2S family protein